MNVIISNLKTHCKHFKHLKLCWLSCNWESLYCILYFTSQAEAEWAFCENVFFYNDKNNSVLTPPVTGNWYEGRLTWHLETFAKIKQGKVKLVNICYFAEQKYNSFLSKCQYRGKASLLKTENKKPDLQIIFSDVGSISDSDFTKIS